MDGPQITVQSTPPVERGTASHSPVHPRPLPRGRLHNRGSGVDKVDTGCRNVQANDDSDLETSLDSAASSSDGEEGEAPGEAGNGGRGKEEAWQRRWPYVEDQGRGDVRVQGVEQHSLHGISLLTPC